VLAIDGGAATFYAGAVDLVLHRTETGQYRDNLASGAPSLWVALRTTGGEPPLRVGSRSQPIRPRASRSRRRATNLVGAVPMPAAVRDMVEAFVVEHHVEQPFFKRQRDRADPESLAHRRPTEKGKGR